MESDYRTANKVFWQTIRRLRQGWQHTLRTMKDWNREVLAARAEILGRWKEHFEELLNPPTADCDVPYSEPTCAENSLTMELLKLFLKLLQA